MCFSLNILLESTTRRQPSLTIISSHLFIPKLSRKRSRRLLLANSCSSVSDLQKVAMTSSPVEKTDELTVQRTIPTPFLSKTYQLVDDPSSDEMISWNENGSAFVVWQPAEFARDLLPKYFKHSNFSSFIRQLNTYGFRKIVSDRWEFANDYFRRGEKSLLREIHRRKISLTPTTNPATSSSEELAGGSSTDLFEENERLKEQNSNLRYELDHLRSMCCNIVTMMSNFIVKQPVIDIDEPSESGSDPEVGDEMSPRLFGVSIGAKRVRRSHTNSIGNHPGDGL